jgi:enamine deaminase RidA (YjgF/YER057c/UK114 family)
LPATFEAQAEQALENVKAVVEAAGLTLDHVVYTHAYLEDLSNSAVLDRVYARYFPKEPPARGLIGVAHLPGSPVEVNAVAVLNRDGRAPVTLPGFDRRQPFSPGMLTHDRLFISSLPGRNADGSIPTDPASEVNAALDAFKGVTDAAGLSLAHVVFVNPYLTGSIPSRVMNELYANGSNSGTPPPEPRSRWLRCRPGTSSTPASPCAISRSGRRCGRGTWRRARRQVRVSSQATPCIARPRAASFRDRYRESTRQPWSTRSGKPCATNWTTSRKPV